MIFHKLKFESISNVCSAQKKGGVSTSEGGGGVCKVLGEGGKRYSTLAEARKRIFERMPLNTQKLNTTPIFNKKWLKCMHAEVD